MKLEIDPGFKYHLIPQISKEEYRQLKENILKEGKCRDAITVWTETINGQPGRTLILDGHNRYEICKKYKIHYEKTEVNLKNRQEAKLWIIQNQLGRRNITDYHRAKLTSYLKEMIQKKAKEKQREGGGAVRQKSDKPAIRTDEELAKLGNVSRDTIRKVEIIEREAPPEIKEAAEKGEISINKAYKKTRAPKPSKNLLIFKGPFIEELSSYIRTTTNRLERALPHLGDLKPDAYNGLMTLLSDLGEMINDATFQFRVEKREVEAEEAKKKDEEISPLLEKDEEDLTEEEKAKVDAYYNEVSPYYLYKEKFERCEEAWRELSKKQKKEFANRYYGREVNP